MAARGKAVRSAVSSGRHAITKGMRKTRSIGQDIERWWKVNEVQIPGTQDALYRAFLDSLPIGTDFLDEGKQLAKDGKVQDALAAYAQARQIDPTLNISAVDWNQLCWFGSLSGQATAVMKACQQAVSLNPEDGDIRDSRGLARALAGDTKGAIEDFSFFVEWTKKTGKRADLREQREQWIAALKAGKNPFDAETLKKLREQ